MAWIVWIVLTLLAVAASYALAAAIYPERGTSHRLMVASLLGPSLVLAALDVCGYTGQLTAVKLGVFSTLFFAGTLYGATRHLGRDRLLEIARRDLEAPGLLWRDTLREREVAVLVLVPATIAISISLLIAWTFRSWTFDPVWYHVPITGYAIQNAGLGWVDTHVNYIAGYPNNVELLAVWNCIFPRDNRFDETSQYPFVLLGVLLTVAWARKVGASRPMALAVGAAWMALPPVFLLAHTTYVDIACNACLATSIYFAAERPTPRDRWMCLLAMGLFVGTKYSGAYHLLVVAPWLAGRALWELWQAYGDRLRRLGDILLSVALFAAIGLPKYVQNALHAGNPLFPFRTKLPIVGVVLPGTEDAFAIVAAPGEEKPWLFGTQKDLQTLLDKWLIENPHYTPEVHDGGYGPSFLWFALPCLFFVAGDAVRGRRWKQALPIVILFLLVIRQPMGWWPRYTLAAPLAAMVAVAFVHAGMRSRIMKLGFSLAFAWLVWTGYAAGKAGFGDVYPSKFARAWRAGWEERAWQRLEGFQWPEEFARLKETELDRGDVITYDDSASFIGEYFTHDYRTRVTYVDSREPEAFLQRVVSLKARWVGVRGGSAAEEAVRRAGGVRLFNASETTTVIYRMPRV